MKTILKSESKSLAVNTEHQWRYLARCSSQQARDLISNNVALEYLVLPMAVIVTEDEKLITLLSGGELDFKSLEDLRFISGCRISYEITKAELLEKAIHAAYRGEDRSLTTLINKSKLEITLTENDFAGSLDATIPNLLNSILDRAEILSASDVHIEPLKDNFRIRYRINGQLLEDQVARLERHIAHNLIRCIKVKAHLENLIGACDGKFITTGLSAQREIRVSVLQLNKDQKIVLRFFGNELLSNAKGDYFEKLGLSLLQKKMLLTALDMDSGVLIVAGPTGSGKSTLLYSCLLSLDLEKMNVITIEDPVEHEIEGVSQINLPSSQNLSYKQVLPFVLRQDPDLLMLGEIRDDVTAKLAFEAALTGKLILTTVHAANCIESLIRLNSLGICTSLLSSSLRLLISGRLIARNCKSCLAKSKLPQRFVDYFSLTTADYYYSQGCKYCSNSRIGVYEFLPISGEIRKSLNARSKIFLEEIKEQALAQGYHPFTQQVLDYLTQGTISFESACKSLGIARCLFDP